MDTEDKSSQIRDIASTFSDVNFDEIQWINQKFSNESSATKEETVAQMVSELQIFVQQVNNSIDTTKHSLMINMPKVIKDVQNVASEASLLRTKMTEVQKEISKIESETGTCMLNLERLDSLKTSLSAAKQGLQESDSWGKLTGELDDLLERKDIPLACEKLDALQKSLIAQQGLAGQSEREFQLEAFKNRLEALISPILVTCFGSGDIEESKKYVAIFTNMGRSKQLKDYYRSMQKQNLQIQWREIIETVENQGNERFMRDFYEHLRENWLKQMKWCSKVFQENGILEGIKVISELLPNLDPSRKKIVEICLKNSSEENSLEFLLEISQSNVSFGKFIKMKLEENDVQLSPDHIQNLTKEIFEYFNYSIVRYSTIEQRLLNSKLEELNLKQPTASDTIRGLENANSKVFEWSYQIIKRCEDITQNCAIVSTQTVLNTFYINFLDKYRKAQSQLEASRTDHQDWNLLQLCITLLQTLGTMKLKINEVDSTMREIVLRKEKEIKENEQFCYQIEIKKFEKFLKEIQENDNTSNDLKVFKDLLKLITEICEDVHRTMLFIVLQPIVNYFNKIEINEDTTMSDLPDFSYTPMEYITLIGQYLLTLPQHLEPLLLNPSNSLKIALELSAPDYKENIPSADVLLSLVAEDCCVQFQDIIKKIFSITSNGAKQLATDIDYLENVLEELGLTICSSLQQTAHLLKAPSDPKGYIGACNGVDPKLVTEIRQKRNINMNE